MPKITVYAKKEQIFFKTLEDALQKKHLKLAIIKSMAGKRLNQLESVAHSLFLEVLEEKISTKKLINKNNKTN